MTTFATFIVNGCERVIVSQIIRSPGIYFEKNKNQKKRKLIKRKLSSDIIKLRDFIPLGEPFISEQILTFFPNTYNQSLFQYSFIELQKTEKTLNFNFLETFKIYQIILKTTEKTKKLQRIKIFLHWLNMKEKQFLQTNYIGHFENTNQIKTWNFLLKSLIKYELLNGALANKSNNIEARWLKKIHSTFDQSNNQLMRTENHETVIKYYKKLTEFKLKNNLFLILMANQNPSNPNNQFKFVKQISISKIRKLNNLIIGVKEKK